MGNEYEFRALNSAQRRLLKSLYEQGALKKFIENSVHARGCCRALRKPSENWHLGYDLDDPKEYLRKIRLGFRWESSPEGFGFWSKVFDKVREISK